MVKSAWKSSSFNRPSRNRQENPELTAKIKTVVERHRPAMNAILDRATRLAVDYRENKHLVEKYCPRSLND